ncbi:hypothetical protein Pan44_19880 [Caulifigura coniformis]|uniref:Uncharacterized protein n=1 Tax=Caulifigura coniformis TaxID=2527983 RepID=A0A517SCW5_9PLAN|nr:hypothetical protein [Caulifigura coniformis]QDT53961.1 hypothetical protein Pan44_19880 [Caulifigura coniformis]
MKSSEAIEDNKTSALPVLEVLCERCGGIGETDYGHCGDCRGAGHVLTDAGVQIVNLIAHQFKLRHVGGD